MDSEDIRLSVFLCICADEGMGDKTKSIYPLAFVQRGLARDFVRISPGSI